MRSYRSILKHISTLPTSTSKSSEKLQRVKHLFRQGASITCDHQSRTLRLNAESYAELVASISELKYLRSLDTGEKRSVRETIAASAARVGLSIPEYMTDKIKPKLEEKEVFKY